MKLHRWTSVQWFITLPDFVRLGALAEELFSSLIKYNQDRPYFLIILINSM